jgi:hypothetical protein
VIALDEQLGALLLEAIEPGTPLDLSPVYWVSESGKARRHAPDFFVRRADGTSVLVDVRPDHLVGAADSAVFAATAAIACQAGWGL